MDDDGFENRLDILETLLFAAPLALFLILRPPLLIVAAIGGVAAVAAVAIFLVLRRGSALWLAHAYMPVASIALGAVLSLVWSAISGGG